MLNVAHREINNTDTETASRRSSSDWLRWISAEGQFSVWEKLPLIGRTLPKSGRKPDSGSSSGSTATTSSRQSSNSDTALESRIWSSLPEDVIEKVLAWLPLTSTLRFRSVCRRWKTVLMPGRLIAASPNRPCFLLCTVGQFAIAFDPSTDRWLTLSKPTSPGSSVVTAAGSLLCLGNQVTECRALVIYNPITRCLKPLPPMNRVCLIHKVTMAELHDRAGYRIVVAGEDGLPTPAPHSFNLMTEVYDSGTGKWETGGDPPADAKFGTDPGVWCGAAFYCLTEMPYGVVTFDGAGRTWADVDVAMPEGLCMPALVSSGGGVMMVGRIGVKPTVAICVWELVQDIENNGRRRWLEVVRMPAGVCRDFLSPVLGSYSPFVCAGVGNSVFITTHLNPQVLVFHVASRSWSWLPCDPLFPKFRDFHLLGFSFEPRFDAPP